MPYMPRHCDLTVGFSTPTANPSVSPDHRTPAAVLALLAEKWPACFQIFEPRRRPIKVGIHLDILAALGGDVTSAELKSALRLYAATLAICSRAARALSVSLSTASWPARSLQPKRSMLLGLSPGGGRRRWRRSRLRRSLRSGSGWLI